MANKPDDLDAVRAIAEMLAHFDASEQERIIRWAKERVGLPFQSVPAAQPATAAPETPSPSVPTAETPAADGPSGTDIKSFMEQKKPSSDTEFAAAVAYYYRFEAPVPERRDTIGKDDLLEACRLVGRGRPSRPAQTLVNAHGAGVLDKAERGQYLINTVGENLVAITLPSTEAATPSRRKASGNKKAKGSASSKKTSTKVGKRPAGKKVAKTTTGKVGQKK